MLRTGTLLFIFFLLSAGIASAAVEIRTITYSTKNAGKVVFSHKNHMVQKGINNSCKVCHDSIYSIKKKTSFTMAEMEKEKSCGACHNSKDAFGLNECIRCHKTKEIVYRIKATGATHFSHKKHVALSPNCATCHPALYAAGPNKRATMAEMAKGKSCAACHNGKKAFGIDKCTTCHPVKTLTFRVKETGPTLFRHEEHIETHHCSDCHPKLYSATKRGNPVSMAEMYKGKSCGACHDGKQSFSIKSCSTCHPVKNLTFKVKETGPTLFSHAKHIEAYSCSDCHTKLYPTARRKKPVTMAEMEKGQSCGACHDGKTALPLKDCTICHPTKELSFEVKEAGNVAFSHKSHNSLYRCGECHVTVYATARSTTKVSMKEMENGKSCGACHEGKSAFSVKDKCEACHKM